MAQNSPAYKRVFMRWERDGKTDFTKNRDFILQVREEISKDIKTEGSITWFSKGELPDEIMKEILKTSLIIVGNPNSGKTNTAKILMEKIINYQVLKDRIFRTKIIDTCSNWRFNFEHIPFMEVDKETNIDNYLQEGEKNDNILYDFQQDDVDSIMQIVGESVRKDFRTNRIMKMEGEGIIPYWSVYCIEESQNILGSYSLNKDTGKFWLKAISEGRNFNMTYIWITQRLSDVSTKAVERANGYLFGRILGDNNLLKIRRICGKDSGIHEKVKELGVGEFIYYNGERAWGLRFPKYETTAKPFQIGGIV